MGPSKSRYDDGPFIISRHATSRHSALGAVMRMGRGDGILAPRNTADGPRLYLRAPFHPQFLESPGFIEVVILKSETREGMKKAYNITGQGKKAVPLFKSLEEIERERLEKARE